MQNNIFILACISVQCETRDMSVFILSALTEYSLQL